MENLNKTPLIDSLVTGLEMRNTLMVLGTMFLIMGLVVALCGETFKTKVNIGSEITTGESRNSWEVSETFSNGAEVRLILEIAAGKNWWLWFDVTDLPPPLDKSKQVDVSIIDPKGGKTNITLYYAQAGEAGQSVGVFFGATVNSNDGGLEMEGEYVISEYNKTKFYNYNNRFSAIKKYNGFYHAIITNGYELGSEPVRLTLKEQLFNLESPYFFLVPVGGLVMVIGIILYIVGWRSRKSKRKVRWKSIKDK